MVDKIDINTAGIDDLAHLQGIGEKLAARIIDYRRSVRPFEEVIELAAVPGISERMVREIAAQLTVDAPIAPEPAVVEENASEPADAKVEPHTGQEQEPEEEVEQEAGVEQEEGPEQEEDVEAERSTPQTALVTLPPTAEETSESIEEPPGAPAWRSHLLSALGGALLALLALLLLNGTLEFTGANRVADLQRQVDQLRLDQSRLQNELETAGDHLATVDTARLGLQERADALDGELQSLQEQLETSVTELQDDADQLSGRLDGVAQAAGSFNTFLDGMRDLLITLQGLPPTVTPTPSLTPTPTGATQAPAGETDAAPSATVAGATRTPRPTATPIVPATPGASP